MFFPVNVPMRGLTAVLIEMRETFAAIVSLNHSIFILDILSVHTVQCSIFTGIQHKVSRRTFTLKRHRSLCMSDLPVKFAALARSFIKKHI